MSKKNQQQAEPVQAKTPKQEIQALETAVSTPFPSLQRAHTDPRPLSSADAQILQRTIGNQALRRLIIQRKMTVGPVSDKYEQEADTVAKQVVNKLHDSPAQTTQTAQRQEEEELQMKPIQRQEEEELQAKGNPMLAGGDLSGEIENAVQSAKSGGQPLGDNVRAPMEHAFGADFSSVKVHTGGQSDTLNRSLSARAFTTGQDIFFRQGEYNPSSSSGKELIAHELTHTVQQGAAPQQSQKSPSAGDSVNRPKADSLAAPTHQNDSPVTLQHISTNTSISRSDGSIQRKISMDSSWAWKLGMGWAETGLDKVWNYVDSTFNQLTTLKIAVGEMREDNQYRAQDITEIEEEITRIQQTYNRAINVTEGKALKAALEKLPLQDKLHTILSGKKQDADRIEKIRQQEADIRILLDKLPDANGQPINHQVESVLMNERKELKKLFDNYLRQPAELSQEILVGYTRRTTELVPKWEAAHKRLVEAKRLKLEQQQQEEVDAQRLQALQKENRRIMGRTYNSFSVYCNDEMLSKLLAKTTDYNSLNECRPYIFADKLLLLLDKAPPRKLVPLLRALKEDHRPQLGELLDTVKTGQESTLATLFRETNDDKSDLLSLLKKTNGDTGVAHKLLTVAGVNNEKKLVDLLSRGVTPGDAFKLLNTVSGKENIDDIMTLVVYGLVNVDKAVELLNTPGLKGSASDVIDMMEHDEVQHDMGKATSLLSKTGSGTDVMWMLGVKRITVTKKQTEDIMNKPNFKKDKGKKVATILNRDHPDVSVTQLLTLLDTYNMDELDKFLDPKKGGQTYAVLNQHKTKNIWTEAACSEPSYTPDGTSLAQIRGDSGPCYGSNPPQGGRTYGGNRNFGNALVDASDQLLPTVGTNGITVLGYTEYDIHPWTSPNRGTERVVVCSDGRTFYTGSHYASFAKF